MAHNDKFDKQLKDIYYDTKDSGSFGGVQRLLKRAREKGIEGVSQEKVTKFLADQQSYSLHKPARRNFTRNKTIVGGIDRQWQADLADMQGLTKENDGYKYLLTVIDVFSKYAWAIPIKDKGTKSTLEGFKQLFKISKPRLPEKLQTDAGKEFLNKEVQQYFKSKGIHHFVSNSDKKAAVVERFNRTLKTRIWTYFTAHQTNRYIDNLDNFVKSYNESFHRTIGMKPEDVRPKDENKLFLKMFPETVFGTANEKNLKPGQLVRISKVKGQFEKGYLPNWSREHFVVEKNNSGPKSVYKLKDKGDEEVKGSWYPEEVQPIDKNQYMIEKILKHRKRGRKSEVLVKWMGWPAKFNSWIPESDLEKINPARSI